MVRTLTAASLALALMTAAAWAQTAESQPDELPLSTEEAEALYASLRGAYEAAKHCRGIEPSEEDREELAARLNEKTRGQVMPGLQLSMIDAAERDLALLFRQEGCDGPRMSEYLGMYDAHLSDLF